MDALARGRANDFLMRATNFIQSTLRVELRHDDIVVLFRRGEAYQLESEKEFVRYMLIAVAAGSGAATPDPDWIHDIMSRPAPTNQLKLRSLFRAAHDHLPDDVARRAGS